MDRVNEYKCEDGGRTSKYSTTTKQTKGLSQLMSLSLASSLLNNCIIDTSTKYNRSRTQQQTPTHEGSSYSTSLGPISSKRPMLSLWEGISPRGEQ